MKLQVGFVIRLEQRSRNFTNYCDTNAGNIEVIFFSIVVFNGVEIGGGDNPSLAVLIEKFFIKILWKTEKISLVSLVNECFLSLVRREHHENFPHRRILVPGILLRGRF